MPIRRCLEKGRAHLMKISQKVEDTECCRWDKHLELTRRLTINNFIGNYGSRADA